MDCAATLVLKDKTYPCQRPKVKVEHQRHCWKKQLSASSRAELVVTWMQVVQGGRKGLPHTSHRCSGCGLLGHNVRKCPSWRPATTIRKDAAETARWRSR